MLDLNLPIQTRDGRKAVYLGRGFSLGEYMDEVFIASYEETPGNWTVRDYFKSGRGDSEKEIPIDVINVPVKHKLGGVIRIYTDIMPEFNARARLEGDDNLANLIAVIDLNKYNIEYEKGEGL